MLFPLPPPPPLPLFPSPKIWVPYQESKPLTLPYPKGEPTPLTFPLPRIQAPTPHPPSCLTPKGTGGKGKVALDYCRQHPLPLQVAKGVGEATPLTLQVAYPSLWAGNLEGEKGRQLGGGGVGRGGRGKFPSPPLYNGIVGKGLGLLLLDGEEKGRQLSPYQ